MKCLLIFICVIPIHVISQGHLKLWYKKPAVVWTDALPIGNGRLGAMVYGGVQNELIQLNESTLWTGGPVHANVNPGAYVNLLLARQALIKEADYEKAYGYSKKMQGYYSESYLPLGDLKISQDFKDAAPSFYYRDLDIKNAISTTRFTIDHTDFIRQVISSAPDQLIIIHLVSSKKGHLNFTLTISSLLKHHLATHSNNELAMNGRVPSHIEPSYIQSDNPIVWDDSTKCRGMRFELIAKATGKEGLFETDSNKIRVKDATEVTIMISAATSFNGFNKCPLSEGKDEKQLAENPLNNSNGKTWQYLLERHVLDYHHYFNRLSFYLKASVNNANAFLPTDERLIAYTNGGKDPWLETLYFQYGRYLLISSSRTPAVPANLQGIWNKEMRPPWSSNYTTNINVEMNYWPAEETNLSEMHLPLLQFIQNLSVTGTRTAQEFYHARGWVVHHNSDIWAISNPVGDLGHGDPTWANWAMGSPWLSQHLWWHYQFTKNRKYLLDTAYPKMKSAVLFCEDWLVPYDNYLVSAPSVSPENSFISDSGKTASVSIATTMDMSIIRDLFTNTIEASRQLGIDKEFRDSIAAEKKILYPFQIGRKGNLQEWYKDWEDTDPHHRHVSHLFGLFPGQEISTIQTPALAVAAKKTLELRGDEGTGWSLAWKINFWARLHDGNHAYSLLHDLLRLTSSTKVKYSGGGGSYINLFDAHPPFQIDGNFGGLSGIAEMLLQSQSEEIRLLPALPDAWPEGEIAGFKARGNFEIGISWKNKKITKTDLLSVVGGSCVIRTNEPLKIQGSTIRSKKTKDGYLIRLETRKGSRYYFVATNK